MDKLTPCIELFNCNNITDGNFSWLVSVQILKINELK